MELHPQWQLAACRKAQYASSMTCTRPRNWPHLRKGAALRDVASIPAPASKNIYKKYGRTLRLYASLMQIGALDGQTGLPILALDTGTRQAAPVSSSSPKYCL